MHGLPYGFKKFSSSDPLPVCARWKEHMPTFRDPTTYRLYIDARKAWRSKIAWKFTREEATRILTDVKKASELGDWGARALMAHFYLHGLGVLESNHVLDAAPEKSVEIARLAAEAGQPWGLYDLGVAYERGYGNVPQDTVLAWAYYLRAAQLGSPDAQMVLADQYAAEGRMNDEKTMLECAYKQGHGPAAYRLGLKSRIQKDYLSAFNIYQQGVKFGNQECASSLWFLFQDGSWPSSSDEEKAGLKSFGIVIDSERSQRYKTISEALEINPDLKLGKLDQLLPLPPTDVPPWSGIEDVVTEESYDKPTY